MQLGHLVVRQIHHLVTVGVEFVDDLPPFGVAAPAAVDWSAGAASWRIFAATGAGTALVAWMVMLATRHEGRTLTLEQAFLLTSGVWLVLPVVGALPFVMGEPHASFVDALFEAMSGMTTTGATATAGSDVTVHYTGWLYDERAPDRRGTQFDSSRNRNEPFTFLLGAGQVIRGWDDGVAGMRVGGRRTLLIPSGYGYGRRGAGGVIPPNASLVFEVELLDVKPH